MDRITKHISDPSGVTDVIGYTSEYSIMGNDERDYHIADRLADYEDTGLMPDEVPHWIPCGEKMPEDVYGKGRKQITVLVCTASKNVKPCSRVREYKWDKEAERYEETENFTWNKCKNPAFWMPYPQPPKGEK